MSLLETLVGVAKPWAVFYSDSTPAQAVVMFTHLAGMLGGGGLAISADRALWKARTASDDARARLLADVAATHRPVMIGLTMSVISGILLTAADLEEFATSPIWWGKMAAFALLLANGFWLQTIERGARKSPASLPTAWGRLSLSSAFSYTLWFAVMLGGVLLMSA